MYCIVTGTQGLKLQVQSTIKRKSKQFTSEDLAIVSTYLFCSLVYRNWQRPGAAINLTTHEAAGAVERDGHIAVRSLQHKTALAHGPAVMVLPEKMLPSFSITGM